MVLIILFSFIFVCIAVDLIVQYNRKKKSRKQVTTSPVYKTISEHNVLIPKGLFFGKGHMWAFMEKNGSVRIGIDDFIGNVTGNFNRVKMKSVGEKVQKGKPVVSVIQKGKLLSVNSPVSGTVSTVNEDLYEFGQYITSSPYTNGWIYTITPTNWPEDVKQLMPCDIYKDWLKNEFIRLKDFLATVKQGIKADTVPVLYQDGGELRKYFMEDMGPEIWDDFQTNFINSTSK